MTKEQLLRLSNRELAAEFARVVAIFLKQRNVQAIQGESVGMKVLVTSVTALGRLFTRNGIVRTMRERLDCGAISREEMIDTIIEHSNAITRHIEISEKQNRNPKPIPVNKPTPAVKIVEIEEKWKQMNYEQKIQYAKNKVSLAVQWSNSSMKSEAMQNLLRAEIEQFVDALSLEEFREYYNYEVLGVRQDKTGNTNRATDSGQQAVLIFSNNLPCFWGNPNDILPENERRCQFGLFWATFRIDTGSRIKNPTYRDMLVAKIMYEHLINRKPLTKPPRQV